MATTIAAREVGNVGGGATGYAATNGGLQMRARGAVGAVVENVIGSADDSVSGAVAAGALGGAIGGDGWVSGAIGGLSAYIAAHILKNFNNCNDGCQ
jgi:hypothetical protein